MDSIAYIATAFIGISLGLIGGGGSILTMPVLVYLFSIDPFLATSYSLFIVGSTSLIGAITNYLKGQINLKASFFFGATSILTVFGTRKFIIPLIPEKFTLLGLFIDSGWVMMLLFSMLMLIASVNMIKKQPETDIVKDYPEHTKLLKLLGYGVSIGLVTGLLGAGGGFLLIPALVFLIKLPMKEAVGTSLLIIALNSLVGFAGDLGHFTIDWIFLLRITGIAIIGILIGGLISRKIAAEKLKMIFGWFILTMAIYLVFKEISVL